jgi:hypothetical protein
MKGDNHYRLQIITYQSYILSMAGNVALKQGRLHANLVGLLEQSYTLTLPTKILPVFVSSPCFQLSSLEIWAACPCRPCRVFFSLAKRSTSMTKSIFFSTNRKGDTETHDQKRSHLGVDHLILVYFSLSSQYVMPRVGIWLPNVKLLAESIRELSHGSWHKPIVRFHAS